MNPGASVRIADLLIGGSGAMCAIRRDVERFGPTPLPVLIEGPTGAGKELVARAFHIASGRRGSLVAFNVCALNDSMFEDALFGHVRGAFTGAASDSAGYLAEANGGSIFLDEISGLGLHLQSKLLRALETGTFRPVGAARDRVSDFRIIAASNENLKGLVQQGHFRMDLLQRISGVIIKLPPLSDRPDDIPSIVRHFAAASGEHDLRIADDAWALLKGHSWPGNVRELRHAMDRVLVLAGGEAVCAADVARALDIDGRASQGLHEEMQRRLCDALETSGWDTAEAARALGVHRATVYRWIRRLNLSGSQSVKGIKEPASGARVTARGLYARDGCVAAARQ